MKCLFLLFSKFLGGRGKSQITETEDTESVDAGVHLYRHEMNFCSTTTTKHLQIQKRDKSCQQKLG